MSERAKQIAARLLEEAHVDPATLVVVPPPSMDFCPIEEVIGRDYTPPHMNVDPDTELDMAERGGGFTALELAQRRNINHPRLLKAVTGTPYEPLYRRHFKLPQTDQFYASDEQQQQPAQAPEAPKPKQKTGFTDFFRKMRGQQ